MTDKKADQPLCKKCQRWADEGRDCHYFQSLQENFPHEVPVEHCGAFIKLEPKKDDDKK